MNVRYVHANAEPRCSGCGSGIKPLYKRVRSDRHGYDLVRVGETDQNALIQSFRDSVDVNKLIERYNNGDVAALQRMQAVYSDVSGVATNLTEVLETVDRAREFFDGLDESTRAHFPDFVAFLNAIQVVDPSASVEKEVHSDVEQ